MPVLEEQCQTEYNNVEMSIDGGTPWPTNNDHLLIWKLLVHDLRNLLTAWSGGWSGNLVSNTLSHLLVDTSGDIQKILFWPPILQLFGRTMIGLIPDNFKCCGTTK